MASKPHAETTHDGTVREGEVVLLDFGGGTPERYVVGTLAEVDDDVDAVTPSSPLGRALLGAVAGTAVSYALRLEDMLILRVPDVVLDSPALMNVGTWTILLGELMLGVLIWIRRIGPVVVAIGLALHLTIMVTIAVGFFSPAMLLLYLAFLPSDVAERRVRRRAGATRSEPGEPQS